MKYLFLFVTATILYGVAVAQKKQKIVFNSYNSIGFVAGKSPVEFAAQTENGIKINNWFVGAGIAIDNYFIQSLPVFASLKKEFLFKTNSLFLYANAGTNFIAKDKNVVKGFSKIETIGQFYADAGVGYKINISKTRSVILSLGNTRKNIKQTETSTDTGFPYSYLTKNKLSCITFKIGLQL
jgi:hypothetical protein